MNNINYKEIKKRNNERSMPKFYNGADVVNKGYQQAPGATTAGSMSTSAYDMSNDISVLGADIWHKAVGGVGSNAAQIYTNYFNPSNYISEASAATKNLNNYLNTFGKEPLEQAVKNGASYTKTIEDGLKSVGDNVEKAGPTALGKALSVAGIVTGSLGAVNDITNFSNRYRGSDLYNMSGTSRQSKNGQYYDVKTGFDQEAVRQMTGRLNTADTISLASNLASVGGGVSGLALGSSLGAWAGPVGMGLGALAGWGLGAILGSSRKNAVKRDMARTLDAIGGENDQNESEAASRGLRLADNGLDVNGKQLLPQMGMVRTENGIEPGYVGGLSQGGEGVYNTATGQGSINPGNNRNDNIPTGVSANDSNPQETWNNTVIFGNDKNPRSGKTFKEDAAPWLKILEKGGDSKTDKRNQDNARAKLNELTKAQYFVHNTQSDMNNIRKRMTPQFDGGISPIWSYVSGIPYAMGESLAANRETPYTQNSYIANPSADNALRIMRQSRVNPNPQIEMVNRAARQGLYNANLAGGLNSAARTGLKLSYLNDTQRQVQSLINAANEQNMKNDQAYAAMLGEYGEKSATRQQQALAAAQEAYRQAVGAKQKWQAQARKNWYTVGRQGLLDYNTWDTSNRTIDIYDLQVKNDRDKMNTNNENRYVPQLPQYIARPTNNKAPEYKMPKWNWYTQTFE